MNIFKSLLLLIVFTLNSCGDPISLGLLGAGLALSQKKEDENNWRHHQPALCYYDEHFPEDYYNCMYGNDLEAEYKVGDPILYGNGKWGREITIQTPIISYCVRYKVYANVNGSWSSIPGAESAECRLHHHFVLLENDKANETPKYKVEMELYSNFHGVVNSSNFLISDI